MTYLVQVSAQCHFVHVDHTRLMAESDSYRYVTENAVPVIPTVLE